MTFEDIPIGGTFTFHKGVGLGKVAKKVEKFLYHFVDDPLPILMPCMLTERVYSANPSKTFVLKATLGDYKDREIVFTLDGDAVMDHRKAEKIFEVFYPLQWVIGEISIELIQG